MEQEVEVAIIGAGSAGLYALGQVRRKTDRYVLIDGGELGTTCARVGCMPSKALIQIAEDFHRRTIFPREGIEGGDTLSVEGPDVLEHVQDLRDIFVDKVLSSSTDDMGEKFIPEYAQFIEPGLLQVGERRIRAKRIVIASGSTPVIPSPWKQFGDSILTTDEIFELEKLPESLAVIGLGVIGLELGQAFHRLGVKVTGIDQLETIGHIDDPDINKTAIQILGKEMPLWLGQAADIEQAADGRLRVSAGDKSIEVEKVLVCIGRRPNLENIGIENAGVKLNAKGIPDYNPNTMQIEDKPLFIAGDVNGDRPVLHEAADEGRIAGINAVAETPMAFRRKTPLFITFSDPNLVLVGKTWSQLDHENTLISSVALGMLGRALIMGRNKGLLRLYADKSTGKLLGASMIAPHGEHLGHLMNWCIEQELTVLQMVRMPFYHPVLEEAIQPVLREMIVNGGFVKDDLPPDLERR
ncbi:dihydrolipoamide dehydrogenase [Thiogranum longum]|uniref:Dihydrolipoamide dehydrogenase n=1 Tax=Thiogranum longum TaxID=1537524 RepID=A0A4R1HDI1_9GAMM|nr:dihydrolipoyl dehydrogenase [Thiogranum longum]TCK18355.1 dihydrolipoamide dehydrogenase [Thiogranum longum]